MFGRLLQRTVRVSAVRARIAVAATVQPIRCMSTTPASAAGAIASARQAKPVLQRVLTEDEKKQARAAGMTRDQMNRKVRIYQPMRQATQQGEEQQEWVIEFDRGAQQKWINPLMGWTSSNDTSNQLDVNLKFENKQEAMDYCLTHGLEFEILEPTTARKKPKSYADNFKYRKSAPQ